MSDNDWYYYRNENVCGPVTLHAITKMIDSGELNDDSAICEGRDGEWKYLKDLAASAPRSTHESAEAAVTKMKAVRPGGGKTQSTARKRVGGRGLSFADLLTPVVDFAFSLFSPLGRISRQGWTAIGAVFGLLAIIFAVSRFYYHSTQEKRAIAAVQSVWTEYEEFQRSKPSDLVWNTFRQEAQAALSSASEVLARNASSQQSMDTLRIGRDVLPKLLDSWPEADDAAINQCQFLFARNARTLSAQESPWWVTTIIGFDVVLAVGGLWWFLIR